MMQAKDPLKLHLKLIVMMSLSIDMMTSQDRICVQCVTNGLQGKDISTITNEFTVERSHLYVLCVTNDLE